MNKIIRRILLFICICVFLFSAFQLGKIFYNYYTIEKESAELVTQYVEEPEEEKEDPLKRVVNFEELQNINSDVIGWLYIPDTKIDEPILKGENNNTYLYTDLYMKSNTAGNVFIDEINSRDFSDDNTIIYGHNMKNTTMFSQLEKFKEESFFKSNPTITLTDKNGEKNYEVFAVLLVKKDYPYTIPNFNSDDEYNKFLNKIVDDSIFSTQNKPTSSDKILTLSTCSYEFKDARTVVFCKEKKRN